MSQPLNTPILWINEYLKEKLSSEVFTAADSDGVIFDDESNLPPEDQTPGGRFINQTIPFFPTGPSTIDILTEQFVNNGQDVIAVYDRMFRRRRQAFPHIKCEQVLYYFYANGINDKLNMIKIQEGILNLLDNEDESAEDINKWAIQKGSITLREQAGATPITLTPKFHFHSFRIYHLEEARDIVDFGSSRTFAGNKIIVDYDYHSIKN